MFRASWSSSSGVRFFTVQAGYGILCNLSLYSTRSPTSGTEHVGERVEYSKRLHSMREAACTVKR